METRNGNGAGYQPAFPGQTRVAGIRNGTAVDVAVVSGKLSMPWAVEPLPDGRFLVTERRGTLQLVSADGQQLVSVAGVPEVRAQGQAGLHDVALDPDFASTGIIYLSYTEAQPGGYCETLARAQLLIDAAGARLQRVQVLFRQLPVSTSDRQMGSRIVIGADGKLYFALGERGEAMVEAQDPNSHIGKVVRLNTDGSVPADNPFVGRGDARPEVWTTGHRNVQAFAMDAATGKLWLIEHGPRGGDELNLLKAGANFGWPVISYGIDYSGKPVGTGLTRKDGMEQPVYYWDPVIAPSGMAVYRGKLFPEWQGSIFVGGLAGLKLVRLQMDGDRVVGEEWLLADQPRRVRDVQQDAAGAIYVLVELGETSQLLKLTPRRASQTLLTQARVQGGDAAAGVPVYYQSCALCHGQRLEGSPFGPTLVGQAFLTRWGSKPAAELLAQIRATMPPKGAPQVKPEAFPNLLALILEANTQGAEYLASLAPTVSANGPTAGANTTANRGAGSQAPSARDARRLDALSPVTEAMLAAPPAGDWLAWRRTPDAQGFSPLRQVDRSNVHRLRQAWSVKLDASANEIAPLVHEGVLFVYSGNGLEAIDGATGRKLWRNQRVAAARPDFAGRRPPQRGGAGPAFNAAQFEGGQNSRMRSMAMLGHALFLPTVDGHVQAIDARNGKLMWDRAITASIGNGGVMFSTGPLVARGMVILGASLGLTSRGGNFIVALDAATGEERWRFHTIARPGAPGGDTWNDAPLEERFGAGVWTTGSHDPQLDLVFFGVGNTYTTATLLEPRAGSNGVTGNDGLFTNSTIALRPATGELVWHYQHHRRDVWDQDWAFEQTLVTLGEGANARRAVVTGGKGAVFDAVDAATGRFLFAHDSGMTNLFTAIDASTGEKLVSPALQPVAGKNLLLCPGNLGARNWPATSWNQSTGILFVPMLDSCANYTYSPRSAAETAKGGTDIAFSPQPRPGSDGNLGRVVAIDLHASRVLWTHRQPMPLTSSMLATAGGVVFVGDVERNLSAHDQASGQLLWRTRLPAAAESTPLTYAVDGRQYIAVVSGEGSHLGSYNRRLVPALPAPNNEISLVVYSLR